MRRSVMFVLAIAVAITFASTVAAMRQTDSPSEPAVAESPLFDLVVYQVHDPYEGTIVAPAELDPAMRYVGAEVAIINHDAVSLTTGRAYVRLRDAEGRDYTAGLVLGAETGMQNRVLLAGEQVRGWVWYAVPADVEISHIYLVVPTIDVLLPWDDAPEGPLAGATPQASPESALPNSSQKVLPSEWSGQQT